MWQRRCSSIWWGWRQREAVLGSHGQVGGGAAMARPRWSLASSERSVIPVRRGERRCFPGDAGLGFLRGEAGLIVARSFLGVGDGRCGQSWTWPEVLVGCGPSCRLGVDVWPRFPCRVVGRWSSAMQLLRQVLRWRRCEASGTVLPNSRWCGEVRRADENLARLPSGRRRWHPWVSFPSLEASSRQVCHVPCLLGVVAISGRKP